MRCTISIGIFLWNTSVLATEMPDRSLATLKCDTFVEIATRQTHDPSVKVAPIQSAIFEYFDRFAKAIDVRNVNKTPKEEEVQRILGNDGVFLLVKRVLVHCNSNPDHLFKNAVHIVTSNMR